MRIVLVALLLIGCPTPDGPDPINPPMAAPVGAADAFKFAVADWEHRLGPPGHNPHDTVPRVRWFEPLERASDGKCCFLEYDDIASDPVRVKSMYWPYNFAIHVTPLTSDRPSGSGLSHEILHWILASSGRDIDGNYQNPIWDQDGAVKADLIGAGL